MKHFLNLKTRNFIRCVAALSGAGLFGLVKECLLDNFVPQEMLGTSILVTMAVCAFFALMLGEYMGQRMFFDMKVQHNEYIKKTYGFTNNTTFVRRMKNIQTIANRNMKRGSHLHPQSQAQETERPSLGHQQESQTGTITHLHRATSTHQC